MPQADQPAVNYCPGFVPFPLDVPGIECLMSRTLNPTQRVNFISVEPVNRLRAEVCSDDLAHA